MAAKRKSRDDERVEQFMRAFRLLRQNHEVSPTDEWFEGIVNLLEIKLFHAKLIHARAKPAKTLTTVAQQSDVEAEAWLRRQLDGLGKDL